MDQTTNQTDASVPPFLLTYFDPAVINALDPLANVHLAVNAVAFVLFYIFKNQRKFPSAALGWTLGVNVLISLVSTVISAPQFVVDIFTPPTCFGQIFVEEFLTFVMIGCNNSLAVILFVSIKMRRNMEYAQNKNYLIGCTIGVFSLPSLMVFLMAVMPYDHAFCTGQTPYLYVGISVSCFCVLGQLCLMIPALLEIRDIQRRSQDQKASHHDRRLFHLAIRLVLVWSCQVIGFLPLYAFEVNPDSPSEYGVFIRLLAGILDAAVVTCTNRELWIFVNKKLKIMSSHSSTSSSDGGSHKMARKDDAPRSTSSGVTMSATGVTTSEIV